MSKAKWFLLVAVAMLAVPIRMVWQHEQVLRSGEAFLFKTAPIDPRDPFRGEYVSLAFVAESGDWTCKGLSDTDGPQEVYAQLGQDSDGLALITGLSMDKPASGPYVRAKARIGRPGSDQVNRVELPFDRYYLQEGQGPRTEKRMMPGRHPETGEGPMEAWAVVKVRNGRAVVADLVVGGKPIREWRGEE